MARALLAVTVCSLALVLAGCDRPPPKPLPPPTVIPSFRPWRAPPAPKVSMVYVPVAQLALAAPTKAEPPLDPNNENDPRNQTKGPKSYGRARNVENTGAFIVDNTVPEPDDTADKPPLHAGM